MIKDYSYVFNAHPSYIENLYQKYLNDPDSVEDGWKTFFYGFEFKSNGGSDISLEQRTEILASPKEISVALLINGFRTRGHLLSTTNPIRERRDRSPYLNLEDYYLSEEDLDQTFSAGSIIGLGKATLRQIIERLQKIYCGNIGFEFAYIEKKEKKRMDTKEN